MSVSDLAIVAALIFAWGTVSAWLERFDSAALPELPTRAGSSAGLPGRDAEPVPPRRQADW